MQIDDQWEWKILCATRMKKRAAENKGRHLPATQMACPEGGQRENTNSTIRLEH